MLLWLVNVGIVVREAGRGDVGIARGHVAALAPLLVVQEGGGDGGASTLHVDVGAAAVSIR